MTMAVARLLF
jgi:hypothetical protein